jgi:hypothetical protein
MVKHSLRVKHLIDNNFQPFLPVTTLDAINAAKSSSATGPDGLTSIHLKYLGPQGVKFLTDLFNLSVSKADLPAVWKAAMIVPVLKPGKPANAGSSYRPISLLSPAVKVMSLMLCQNVILNMVFRLSSPACLLSYLSPPTWR